MDMLKTKMGGILTKATLVAGLVGVALAVTVAVGIVSSQAERSTWFGQTERLDAKVQYDYASELVHDSIVLGVQQGLMSVDCNNENDLAGNTEESIETYLDLIEEGYKVSPETHVSLTDIVIGVETRVEEKNEDETVLYLEGASVSSELSVVRNQPRIRVYDSLQKELSFEDNCTVLRDEAEDLKGWLEYIGNL